MKIDNHEIGLMSSKINDIYTKTEVIETKVIAMEEHMRNQNGRLEKHDNAIDCLKTNYLNLKGNLNVTNMKIWVLLLIGGIVGGVIGSVSASVVTKIMFGGI